MIWFVTGISSTLDITIPVFVDFIFFTIPIRNKLYHIHISNNWNRLELISLYWLLNKDLRIESNERVARVGFIATLIL